MEGALARGSIFTLFSQFVKLGLMVVGVVALGRILTPTEVGVYAMTFAVLGVGELLRDFGLISAAVRQRDLPTQQASNLFWLNSGMGFLLSVLGFVLAPFLGHFYGRQDVVPIAQAISTIFFMNGLAAQSQVQLIRASKFKELAFTDIGAQALALSVAVLVGITGGGAWALVAQVTVASLALLISRTLLSRWLPRLPRDFGPTKSLLRFGGYLGLAQLLNYASSNYPAAVLGVTAGASSVGHFNRSYQIVSTPINQVYSPLTNIVLRPLSSVHDARHLADLVLKLQVALSFPTIAALAFIGCNSSAFLGVVLGNDWIVAGATLTTLCLAVSFQALSFFSFWVFLARDKSGELLLYNLVTKGLAILLISGGLYASSLTLPMYALGLALAWPISLTWLSKRLKVPTRFLFVQGTVSLSVSWSAALVANHLLHSFYQPTNNLLDLFAAACVTAFLWMLVFAFRYRKVMESYKSTLSVVRRRQP